MILLLLHHQFLWATSQAARFIDPMVSITKMYWDGNQSPLRSLKEYSCSPSGDIYHLLLSVFPLSFGFYMNNKDTQACLLHKHIYLYQHKKNFSIMIRKFVACLFVSKQICNLFCISIAGRDRYELLQREKPSRFIFPPQRRI